MLFTVGQRREFERMMQETPGFERHPVITMKKRDCELCLYFDEKSRTCIREKCIVFED